MTHVLDTFICCMDKLFNLCPGIILPLLVKMKDQKSDDVIYFIYLKRLKILSFFSGIIWLQGYVTVWVHDSPSKQRKLAADVNDENKERPVDHEMTGWSRY